MGGNVDPDCVYGSVNGLGSTRSIAGHGGGNNGVSTRSVSVTPPMYKKSFNPSPAYHRLVFLLADWNSNMFCRTRKL